MGQRLIRGAALGCALSLLEASTAHAQYVASDPEPLTDAPLRPSSVAFTDVLPFRAGYVAGVATSEQTSLAVLDASGTNVAPVRPDSVFANRVGGGRLGVTPSGFMFFGSQFISGEYQLRAQVIDSAGAFVGTGIRIANVSTAAGPLQHRIACSASNCLLVWLAGGAIRATRISHTGVLIDAAPFTVHRSASPTATAFAPAVATDGVDYLVAYALYDGAAGAGVWVQKVDAATATLVGGAPTRASMDSAAPTLFANMQVAFHNGRYAVAWLLGAPVVRIFDRDAVPVAANTTTLDVTPDTPAGWSRVARGVLAVGALSDDRFVLAWHMEFSTGGGMLRDLVFSRGITRDQEVLGARSNLIDGDAARPAVMHVARGATSVVLTWTRYPEGVSRTGVLSASRLGADGEALDTPPLAAYRAPSHQSAPRLTRLSDGTTLAIFADSFGMDPVDGARSGMRAVRISAQGVVLSPAPLELGQYAIAPVAAGDGQFLIIRSYDGRSQLRRFYNDLRPIDADWQSSNLLNDPVAASVANDYLIVNSRSVSAPMRAGFVLDASGRLAPLADVLPAAPLSLLSNSTHWLLYLGSELSPTSCAGLRLDRAGTRTPFTWTKTATTSCITDQAHSDPWGTTLLARSRMFTVDPSGVVRSETPQFSTLNYAQLVRAPAIAILGETQRDPIAGQFDLTLVPDFEPPTRQRALVRLESTDFSLSTGLDRIFIGTVATSAASDSPRAVIRTVRVALPIPPPIAPPAMDASTGDASADGSMRDATALDGTTVDAPTTDTLAIDASSLEDRADSGRSDAPLDSVDEPDRRDARDAVSDERPGDSATSAPRASASCACAAVAARGSSRRSSAIAWLAMGAVIAVRRRGRSASATGAPRSRSAKRATDELVGGGAAVRHVKLD